MSNTKIYKYITICTLSNRDTKLILACSVAGMHEPDWDTILLNQINSSLFNSKGVSVEEFKVHSVEIAQDWEIPKIV